MMTKSKKNTFKSVNYPLGDFLIKIKNAVLINQKEVMYPESKLIYKVAKKMVDLGFLESLEKADNGLVVKLSFHKKEPVIMNIKLKSKPGLRIYKSTQELEEKKGPSVYIVSTNKGIFSDKEAVKHNVGGEVIAEIL